MIPAFIKTQERPLDLPAVYITGKDTDLSGYSFTTAEFEYIRRQLKADKKVIHINSYFKWSYLLFPEEESSITELKEGMRRQASRLYSTLKENEHEELLVVDAAGQPGWVRAFLEGLTLSHYQFLNHKPDAQDQQNKLRQVQVLSEGITQDELGQMQTLCQAVFYARDLVNEPLSSLNAEQLSHAFQRMAGEAGFSIEVFNKKK